MVTLKGKEHVLDAKMKGESVPLVSASAITSIMKDHIAAYVVLPKKLMLEMKCLLSQM